MRFVAVRLIQLIIVMVVVSAAAFALLNALPGNPVYVLLGPAATPDAVHKLTLQLGLDKPVWQRYFIWMWNFLHGDLGSSFINHQTIVTTIGHRLPVTLELLIFSQVIALGLAIPLGIVAAMRPNQAFDKVASGSAFGILSIPGFILALLLVYLFAVKLQMFPATGFTNFTDDPLENIRGMTLPALTLGLGATAVYMRVLRSDMIATLQQDYIMMARAKGLPTWWILLRHALRPSTFTLITVAGLNIGTLIGGAFVVEYIFGVPGLGLLTINSIYARDYLVVIDATVLVAAGFVIVNFLVDLLYTMLDPRIRTARFAA